MVFRRAAFSALGTVAFLVLASTIFATIVPARLPALSLNEASDFAITYPLDDEPLTAAQRQPFGAPRDTALSRQQAFQKLPFIRSAFTEQDDPHSIKSLRAHLSQLDVVFPDWLSFSNSEGRIDVSVNSATAELLRPAGKFVLPRIS